MKWFKHYTNAHKGGAIQVLRPHFSKAEAYGLYFLFTEFLADKWDGSGEPTFKVFKNELSSFLGLKQKKLSLFLVCLQNESKMSFKETKDFFEIEFPKLLEIKHRDSFPSSQRPAKTQPPGRARRREDKEQEEEGGFFKLYASFPIVTKEFFEKHFGLEFIQEHGPEAYSFFSASPQAAGWSKQIWASKIKNSFQRTQEHLAKQNANLRVVSEADTMCGIAED